MAAGWPLVTRYTRAGAPVARKISPFGATAVAQTALEGVVATSLKAGASSRNPLLDIETPWEVPLEKSSYLFCSQVRVPSPETKRAVNTRVVSRKQKKEKRTRLCTK